ncbi:MAG: hypothetical protein SFV24_21600 [Gemmatimonadales bacterium]|nr:hypothetical protein [Gemmatimonadales bacterium]
MLIVTAGQRTAMWSPLLRQRVIARIREGYPQDFQILGAEQVGRVVDLGIARAAEHGFVQGDEVEKYVDLMFLLGSHFDEDPLLPWAAHILTDQGLASPWIRITTLEVTAAKQLLLTAGAEGEHYRAALVRARLLPYEDLIRVRAEDPVADLQRLLYSLYPELYRTQSRTGLAAMMAKATAAAEQFGMAGRDGRTVLAALMFLVGTHFDRDPLHPWATEALAQPLDPVAKARALHSAAMARLDQYRLVNRTGGEGQ